MPFQVIAVGEILWDLLPTGRQLRRRPRPISFSMLARWEPTPGWRAAVGDDDLGQEAIGRLRTRGVATNLIQVDSQAPTGTVGVEIGPDHQPRFTIHEDVAWDRLAVAEAGAGGNAERRPPSASVAWPSGLRAGLRPCAGAWPRLALALCGSSTSTSGHPLSGRKWLGRHWRWRTSSNSTTRNSPCWRRCWAWQVARTHRLRRSSTAMRCG